MLEDPTSLRLAAIASGCATGRQSEEKMWDYYRRGLPEWWMVWGNNVFSYDRAFLVRTLGSFSRSLEQLGGIAQGVYPAMRIVSEPSNQRQRENIYRLRNHLRLVGIAVAVALLLLLFSLTKVWAIRRRLVTRSER
jgi:hypothetical protein